MLLTETYGLGTRAFQSAYRVWEYRRVLRPNKGTPGLVQFWGEVKKRHRNDDGSWTRWEAPVRCDPDHLCTVDIGDIVSVTDPKRA